jgi:ribosomal protein S4
VWKSKRWGSLDSTTTRAAGSAQLRETVAKIPASTWHILRDKLGSPAAYTAIRLQILAKLRTWISKRQQTVPVFSDTDSLEAQLFLIGLLQKILNPNKSAVGNVFAAKQHLTLRSGAFMSRVTRKATQYLKLRELPDAGASLSPLVREQSRLYKRWLGGVEGMSKRSQLGYIPTSRSHYTNNVAIAFGRRRVRFPASGRRKKSYDSLLHAFAKKVSPSRFRRASGLRFIRALPDLASDFKENLVAFIPLSGALRRRRTASSLSSGAYLSAPWRELLEHRAASGLPPKIAISSAKRRFLSVPTQTVFAESQKQKRALLSPYKQPMYAIRVGILRRALRRRREERAFIDLRRFTLQRRLPREKARRRPRAAHYLKKRRAAVKRGVYAHPSGPMAAPSLWTMVHLSAVGSRTENMHRSPLPPVLPYGEVVSLNRTTLRRKRKSVRGFVVPIRARKTRKLRRRNRDTKARKRRVRRANRASRRAVMRNIRHWSEKKDLYFKNKAFSRKTRWYAQVISPKLHRRAGARTGVPNLLSRLVRNVTSARRSALAAYRAAPITSAPCAGLAAAFGASDLIRKSSLQRRHRVLRLEQKSEFSALRVRSSRFWSRVPRRLAFDAALSAFREQVTDSIPQRLVSAVTTFPAATSLWFQDPVNRVIKSAAAKEQDALAEIAAKEDRYRITAQYVESVTTFIPELMNYMLSKKIENKRVAYTTAQHMVRNIYWSLRVYLNVDPFDIRFFLRDKTPAGRVLLFEDVSDLSVTQKTLQPQRAILRYRFQPSRLLLAPSTKRFRGDWLRAFFPAKHALYQENPEDYRYFLLSTRWIRRLRIGPRGMDSWITTCPVVNHETRARQLLKLRCSRKRRRFETVLQTTRRLPVAEKAPWVSTAAERAPFFARHFSTFSNRGLMLTSRWIHRNKRFVSLEEGWRTVPPVSQVIARNRVLSRIEARGRTSYLNTKRKAITASSLDTRFIRAKSPRSRQYLIRASQRVLQSSKQLKLADLVSYRSLLSRNAGGVKKAALRWTRGTRQTYSPTLTVSKAHPALFATRNRYLLRRVQDALFARSTRAAPTESTRSILHHRTARVRTKSAFHRKPLALLSNAIFANINFSQLRTARQRFTAKRRKGIVRKPRLYLSLKPKGSLAQKKLRLINVNARSNLFGRSAVGKRHKRFSHYFSAEYGRQLARRHDIARACGLYTKFRRQTPFETHRSRLWDRLTLRWMKKYRIGRYWLRDTSHWLRDPWLSEIVAADMSIRFDRYGGQLRSQPQQVGEYVAEVDAFGRDIPRKKAPRERHKYQKIMPSVPVDKDPEIKKTDRILKHGSATSKIVVRHRLEIARQARRKPIPSMRLANYEYRDAIREHKAEKVKSIKQREEEERARVKTYWARKAKKLPPIRPRRLPLKHPANLWLPHVIWKEIQRRIRKFEWRESDEVFFRRGFRTAFQFYPNERRKAPWLEHLLYTRATYSTRLREFRRRQYPHEQKKFKWLQRVRKLLYPGRRVRYIKWRRWPQLRRYNQKLHYSLFNLRDRAAARRHFKRLNGRTRPAISAFVSMSRGLTDRLDVTCLKMGFAPTIYWARIVSEFGLLRVNGTTVYDPSYQLKPADVIYPNWDTVARFQHYFKPYLRAREEQQRRNTASTAFYPTNMEYHRGTRAIIYKHAPDECDLRRSSRIRPAYFRWFKLDSV